MESIGPAYLAGSAPAAAFYPGDFRSEEVRVAAVQKAARAVDPRLVEALAAHSARPSLSDAQRHNLDRLRAGPVATVTTGQQVGLFLGPLYTLYKAAAAIRAAERLTRESGTPVVPIFWLQTEDHDIAEIDHTHVAGRGSGAVERISALAEGAAWPERVSVEHLRLGVGVNDAFDRLEGVLAGPPASDEALAYLKRHYRPEATWPDAFASALMELFAPSGLLVLNPRTEAVASLARPTLLKAWAQWEGLNAALTERSAALEAAGFRAQVPIRADAPLLFFHPDGPQGPRYRARSGEGGTWRFAGRAGEHSAAAVHALVESGPLAISTSALLRPLVQDAILPNAAYVGGPGELSYLAQLPPAYEVLGVRPSLPMPRARFRAIDPRTRSLLQRTGLEPTQVEVPTEHLLAALRGPLPEGFVDPAALRDQLVGPATDSLGALERCVQDLDPTLQKPLTKTLQGWERSVDKLLDRYRSALNRRDEVVVDRAARLQQALRPNGAPQERLYGMASLASWTGVERLVALVLDAVEPFSTEVGELWL